MARIDRAGVDMRRLRYFLAVCEHGGFSRAADAIGIAQPVLTRQVQLLKQEIGVELFTRTGRSAVPTEAGQVLMAAARRHLDSLDLLVDRMRSDFTGGQTRVTLGICPTIAPLFLTQIQETLKAAPGNPTLSVIEAYSGDLRSLMAAGRLDLALSYGPSVGAGVCTTPLLSERLVVVSRAAAGGPLSLPEVAAMKLILPSRIHQLRRIIDRVCAARGLVLTPALELDSLSAVKAALAGDAGDFATILPYHAVAGDAAQGRFAIHLIDAPEMVRAIALLRPATPTRTLPEGLAAQILSRADEIRRTMEAVF